LKEKNANKRQAKKRKSIKGACGNSVWGKKRGFVRGRKKEEDYRFPQGAKERDDGKIRSNWSAEIH